MARLEGFRVRNFGTLKDVTLGRLWDRRKEALTPMTAVIGKNGVGKSALFDAFGFLADALKLETLATEFRKHATGHKGRSQVFITTHQPYFVDALDPKEVWILEKGDDGLSKIRRASEDMLVNNLVEEGLPLGGLWYSDYLDPR